MSNNWQRCHVGRDGNFHNKCMVYIFIYRYRREVWFFLLNGYFVHVCIYIDIYHIRHIGICILRYCIYTCIHIFVQARSHWMHCEPFLAWPSISHLRRWLYLPVAERLCRPVGVWQKNRTCFVIGAETKNMGKTGSVLILDDFEEGLSDGKFKRSWTKRRAKARYRRESAFYLRS